MAEISSRGLGKSHFQSTWAILLGTIFLAICALAVIWLTIGDWERERLSKIARTELNSTKKSIGVDHLRPIQVALDKMIVFPQVLDALNGKNNQSETETLFNGIATGLNAKLVYTINDKGTVVSCNRDEKGISLVGNNYNFRDYFTQALAGKKVLFGALGVTTNERGLYFSSPIFNHNSSQVLGVGVFKIGVENIDKTLASLEKPVVMVSPSGVVFVSNRDKLLYKSIDILNQEKIANLHQSRQFADKKIESLPGKIEYGGKLYDRKHRIEVRTDLDIPGWQLVSWQGVEFPFFVAILLSLLSTSFIGGGGILLKTRQDRLRVVLEINQANIDLQLEIEERKKTEKQLIVARKQSEVANSAKSEFLANMSHEIRTPMNAVIGLTHLLFLTDLTPQQSDYLSKIKLSTDNLLAIINDILDLSKIEAGKLELESIPFELQEDILQNASQITGAIAAEKGLELILDIQQDLPDILVGDPVRLRQIIINLLHNAIKFTEKGEVILSIERMDQRVNDVIIRFGIRDTGIGMTKKQMDRLFKAFSQADASTTRRFGGTGLGLAISKTLVEMMGGRIGAHSVYGEGSTFWFTARFKIAQDVACRKKTQLPDIAQNLRVLIVDDNSTVRTLLRRYLEQFGYRVSAVNSGQKCIQMLQAAVADESFDLVLLDLIMPNMDGIETARRIQLSKLLDRTPAIILLSPYDGHEIVRAFERIEIVEILAKPIFPSSLLDAIISTFGTAVEHREIYDTEKIPEHISGARVLLVEDNTINQQVAREILEQAGVIVTIAENGIEGIEQLQVGEEEGRPFDLVLMDIQMPKMDGYTATLQIRKLPEFNNLPVIAMTADALVSDREKATEVGMDDYVAKPVNINKLYSVLAKWIHISVERRKETTSNIKNISTERSERSIHAAIPSIVGINIKAGLKRVGGNSSLYKRLLIQFLESFTNVSDRIKKAISDGDSHLAVRFAHTLKGAAGNIGATALYQFSGSLEIAIKEARSHDIASIFPSFDKELQKVFSGLREAFPAATDNRDSSIELEALIPCLERLKNYLDDDDPEATDYMSEKKELLSKGIPPEVFSALVKNVENFEFDNALHTIEKVLKV